MTNNQNLKKEQEEMQALINAYAVEKGLVNDKVEPITDGVYDIDGYLASSPKIMWINKEPYETDEEGAPYGGGWSLTGLEFNPSILTHKRMIYTIAAIRENKHWDDFAHTNEEPDELKKYANGIAHINVGKMPGQTSTSDSRLTECYRIWKDILWKQIELYAPDIIIFGNTFRCFYEDFKKLAGFGVLNEKKGDVYVYRLGKQLLLSAYHPGAWGYQDKDYVDGIVDAVAEYFR